MAKLVEDFNLQPKLIFHLLVEVSSDDSCLWASPCFGINSGDVVSLSKANGIITLPAEETKFKKGDDFELITF